MDIEERSTEEKVNKLISKVAILEKQVEKLEETQEALQKDAKVFDV